jgi:hypothetical protein
MGEDGDTSVIVTVGQIAKRQGVIHSKAEAFSPTYVTGCATVTTAARVNAKRCSE